MKLVRRFVLAIAAVGALFGLWNASVRLLTPRARAVILGARLVGRNDLVLQDSKNNCGAAALCNLLRSSGRGDLCAAILGLIPSDRPATMRTIRDAARAVGVDLAGVRSTSKTPPSSIPWLAHLAYSHFVVVIPSPAGDSGLHVLDSAIGHLRFSRATFERHWTGDALVLADSEGFPLRKPARDVEPFFLPRPAGSLRAVSQSKGGDI